MDQFKNEPVSYLIRNTQVSRYRQIITTQKAQNLARKCTPMFLDLVRTSRNEDSPRTRRSRGDNQQSPTYGVAVPVAHGVTEGTKRKISKQSGPKKDLVSMEERERQVLESVPEDYQKSLET